MPPSLYLAGKDRTRRMPSLSKQISRINKSSTLLDDKDGNAPSVYTAGAT
jgi:hypothetical protein